jgi:hypothetical protein
MKPFHEVQARDVTPNSLQEELSSKGYALIRGLIPPEDLTNLLEDVTTIPWGGSLTSKQRAATRIHPSNVPIVRYSTWNHFTRCRITRP